MKIVNFTSGLGNQIFEYIFVEYLRKKYKTEKIYGYYNPMFLNKHNGLEVHKIFDIHIPPSTIWSNTIALMCRSVARLFPFVKSTDKKYSEHGIYYDGWWQDKRFFLDTIEEIRFYPPELNEKNSSLVNKIRTTESVSIHIRRGDYLEPIQAKKYGGICSLNYYKKAVELIKKELNNPQFFVFSNDIKWCQDNLQLENAIFVDNNTGSDSWLDMYLMSLCKANILANSSFSYWGAMLNTNNNIVVFPQKWFNSHTPDIFPSKWIGING